MGLDQYLYLTLPEGTIEDLTGIKFWEDSYWSESTDLCREALISRGLPRVNDYINISKAGAVRIEVAYWRKANAIHRWFVENCQDGKDECQLSDPISPEQLAFLSDLCQSVLDDPASASNRLPTQSGFFFGGTEYDEWYFKDLEETIKQINAALELATSPLWQGSREFRYKSSW